MHKDTGRGQRDELIEHGHSEPSGHQSSNTTGKGEQPGQEIEGYERFERLLITMAACKQTGKK